MECVMCRIQKTLKAAMDEIETLPEIGTTLYDDAVSEAYNALDNAYNLHNHECDDAKIKTHSMKCENCGIDFETDGYVWVCETCRRQSPCECGSDDVALDWHIITDPNGELCPDPAWAVACHACERMTPYFETAKEAAGYWQKFGGLFFLENGDAFTDPTPVCSCHLRHEFETDLHALGCDWHPRNVRIARQKQAERSQRMNEPLA